MDEKKQHKAIEKLLKTDIEPLFQKNKIRLGKTTTSSRHIIHRLYKTLNEGKREWVTTKHSMSMAQVVRSFSVASEFQSVPDHIRQDFRESSSEIEKQYQFRISDRDIKIILTFSNDQFDKSDTFCQECIEKVFLWLYVAIYYGLPANPCSKTLDIHIYFSKAPKELPMSDELIDKHNANTGFSYACAKNNDIYIYRQEEWFKVFIHETMHGLGLDFAQLRDQTISNERIRKLFSLSPEFKQDGVFLYEAYCEFVAEIMNVIIMFGSHGLSERNTRKKIMRLTVSLRPSFSRIYSKIRQEQLFSLFQSVKILRHNGMTYQELLDGPKQYREKTHALSYYIIRSLLLFHFGEFMEWIDENSDPKKSLNFPKTPSGISAFCDFIEERYKSDEYCSVMEILAIWYEKKVKRNPDFEHSFLHKTLRMTS